MVTAWATDPHEDPLPSVYQERDRYEGGEMESAVKQEARSGWRPTARSRYRTGLVVLVCTAVLAVVTTGCSDLTADAEVLLAKGDLRGPRLSTDNWWQMIPMISRPSTGLR